MSERIVSDLRGSLVSAFYTKPSAMSGPPTSGNYRIGDVWTDSQGRRHQCTIAGNPGTWQEIISGRISVGSPGDTPGSIDDDTQGYKPGNFWIDQQSQQVFVCIDNTTGLAIWVELTQAISNEPIFDVTLDGSPSPVLTVSSPGIYFVTANVDGTIRIPSPGSNSGDVYRIYLVEGTGTVSVVAVDGSDIGGQSSQEIENISQGFSSIDHSSEYNIIQDSRFSGISDVDGITFDPQSSNPNPTSPDTAGEAYTLWVRQTDGVLMYGDDVVSGPGVSGVFTGSPNPSPDEVAVFSSGNELVGFANFTWDGESLTVDEVVIASSDGDSTAANYNLNVGIGNTVAGDNNVVMGHSISVTDTGHDGGSVYLGNFLSGPTGTTNSIVNVGHSNNLSNSTSNAVALGLDIDSPAFSNWVAVGQVSGSNWSDAVGVGMGVNMGQSSAALGRSAISTGQNSVAVGRSASATGSNAIAIGRSASATQTYSVAIGRNAVSSTANEIVLGTSAEHVAIPGTQTSTSTTDGALRVAGGVGIQGIAHINAAVITGTASPVLTADSLSFTSTSGNQLIAGIGSGGGSSDRGQITFAVLDTGNLAPLEVMRLAANSDPIGVRESVRILNAHLELFSHDEIDRGLVIAAGIADPGAYTSLNVGADAIDAVFRTGDGNSVSPVTAYRGGDFVFYPGAGVDGGRDGELRVEGDVNITGKLTVAGLIDPTGMEFTPVATHPNTTSPDTAGELYTLWVRSSDGSLMYGNEVVEGPGVSGVFTGSPSPSANQVAFFVGGNEIAGEDEFTWDSDALRVTVNLHKFQITEAGQFSAYTSDNPSSAAEISVVKGRAGFAYIQTGDDLGEFNFREFTGSEPTSYGNTEKPIRWYGRALENHSSTNLGSELVFQLAPIGSNVPVTHLSMGDETVDIPLTTVSTSTTTGALVVNGGVGIAGDLYGNRAFFSDSSNTAGTLQVTNTSPLEHDIARFIGDKSKLFRIRNKDDRNYISWDGSTEWSLGEDSSDTLELKYGGGAATDFGIGSLVWEADVSAGNVFRFGSSFDVEITGKLTVGGLIDPTGLVLDPQASHPNPTSPDTAGEAYTIWIRSSDGALMYGSDVVSGPGASGVFTGSPNPSTDEIAVFSSGNELIGDPNFTWDGSEFAISGNVNVLGGGYVQLGASIRGIYSNGSDLETRNYGGNIDNRTSGSITWGDAFGSTWGNLNSSSLNIDLTTASTDSTTGALVVDGGVGIAGDLHISSTGSINVGSYFKVSTALARVEIGPTTDDDTSLFINALAASTAYESIAFAHDDTVDWSIDNYENKFGLWQSASFALRYDFAATTFTVRDDVAINGTTASTSDTTGALTVAGGVGIGGDVYAGNGLTNRIEWGNSPSNNPGSILPVSPTDWNLRMGSSSTSSGTSRGGFSVNVSHGDSNDNPGLVVGMAIRGRNGGSNSSSDLEAYGIRVAGVGVSNTGAGNNTAYGIYASATGADTNWAGYFAGDVSISGGLTLSDFVQMSTQSESSTATISAGVVKFTGSTASQTLTMPTGVEGRMVWIRNAASVAVTIARAGSDTIEGGTTYNLAAGESVLAAFIGTDWTLYP